MSIEENKSSNFIKCVLKALGKADKCKSHTFTHTELSNKSWEISLYIIEEEILDI